MDYKNTVSEFFKRYRKEFRTYKREVIGKLIPKGLRLTKRINFSKKRTIK